MKPTHLKTLSARIDEISSLYYESDDKRFLSFYMNIHNYNNFLKQPLTLSQFVPCGADGKPLDKPCEHDGCYLKNLEEAQAGVCAAKSCTCKELKAYHKAQKNVIFEGWEVYEAYDSIFRLTNIKAGNSLEFRDFRISFWFSNSYNSIEVKNLADLAAATISNPIKFK